MEYLSSMQKKSKSKYLNIYIYIIYIYIYNTKGNAKSFKTPKR